MTKAYLFNDEVYWNSEEAEDAVFQCYPYTLDDDLSDLCDALIEEITIVDGMDLLKSEKEG